MRPETSKVTRAMNSSNASSNTRSQECRTDAFAEAALEEAVCKNPNLKEFKGRRSTEPEMAADIIDLAPHLPEDPRPRRLKADGRD